MVNYNSIVKAMEEYLEKCSRDGPKVSSGIQTPPPQFEQKGERPTTKEVREIAKATAERWGLEVSINEKGNEEASSARLSFWDEEHKTVIRFDKMLKTGNGYIDWTNKDKGDYNLDDAVRSYVEMPDVFKDHCDGIEFTNNGGASYNAMYIKDLGVNSVSISGMVYGQKPPSPYTLKQVLAHELGHSSECQYTAKQKDAIAKAWTKTTSKKVYFGNYAKLTPEERQLLDRARKEKNSLSRSDDYSNAMMNNKVYFASEYPENRVKPSQKHVEDFAEVMSAVAYRDTDDKSNFQLKYANGKRVDWDTFVADHQGTYNYCCDFVDGKIKP